MAVWESVVEKLRALPPEKQEEVLDFVEFLGAKAGPKGPGRSASGLWADLGADVTTQDIDDARRDAWQAFPRDDV